MEGRDCARLSMNLNCCHQSRIVDSILWNENHSFLIICSSTSVDLIKGQKRKTGREREIEVGQSWLFHFPRSQRELKKYKEPVGYGVHLHEPPHGRDTPVAGNVHPCNPNIIIIITIITDLVVLHGIGQARE